MYITNDPSVAKIAEKAGVDRIFIDMEYIGKDLRQGGMDTVKCRHTPSDVKVIKEATSSCEIMVRVNPIHDKTDAYNSTEDEINEVVQAGADVIMLPYFKTPLEVERFVKAVNGRAKVFPLVETPEAVDCLDEVLKIEGVDEIYVGLNDLSIGYGKKFMFELLTDGTLERLAEKFREKRIPFGFGGIASLGKGMLPAERVIPEHYRLGSTIAILSRSFCNCQKLNLNEIENAFGVGIKELRDFELKCQSGGIDLIENRKKVETIIKQIVENIG